MLLFLDPKRHFMAKICEYLSSFKRRYNFSILSTYKKSLEVKTPRPYKESVFWFVPKQSPNLKEQIEHFTRTISWICGPKPTRSVLIHLSGMIYYHRSNLLLSFTDNGILFAKTFWTDQYKYALIVVAISAACRRTKYQNGYLFTQEGIMKV